MATNITGLEEATRNLNKAIAGIKGRSREGMLAAVKFVESESVPMAPIDSGNLRDTSFSDVSAPNQEPIRARVGYTAPYAPFVHEMIRRFDVGPLNDRSTANFVGPRQRRPRNEFVGPKQPRGRKSPDHRPWAPGTGPKFLERPLNESHAEILAIIASRAKIPNGGR